MTKKIQSIPEARLLLESLRSVGYNEETAIADIIDNCISAKAHEIKIQFDWEKKRIVISDDGLGMCTTLRCRPCSTAALHYCTGI